MNRLLSFLVICVSAWCSADRLYVQDKLVRLEPTTEVQLQYLRDLEDSAGLDFWTDVVTPNRPIDLHLRASEYDYYAAQFKRHSLPFQILVDDLQKVIDEEAESIQQEQIARQTQSRSSGSMSSRIVGTYASYDKIVDFMQEKVNDDSQYVNMFTIGRTFENRIIRGVSLKFNPSSQRNIWIDCGIHAREWITPATCVWMIDTFIKEYKNNDASVRSLLDHWTVYIAPSLNPDGYEYSRSTQRLWRKSRAKYSTSTCYGVDLNRNYPLKWMTGGASNNPCSETYAGPSAGSEIETKGVVDFLTSKNGTWDMYMSFHSYGQWWFTPYGYKTSLPLGYKEQKALADIGINMIKTVNGREYTVGSVAQLLYIASGSTVDWAHDALGIKYSYTIELPPTQAQSSIGFNLPVSLAPGVCDETYRGMKAFLNALKTQILQESRD